MSSQPELEQEEAIINDYGDAFSAPEFSPADAINTLAYSSRRVWGNFSTYTEKESFVWQLLHFLQQQPSGRQLCEFFWRQLPTSSITATEGEAAFWALATGLSENARECLQRMDRWDIKSLIECAQDPHVKTHCATVLAAGGPLPDWEAGIYALLCGQQPRALAKTWDQRVAVRLAVSLAQKQLSRQDVGEILLGAMEKGEEDYSSHALLAAILLDRLPQFLAETPAEEEEMEDAKRYITNVRLECHLAIIFSTNTSRPIREYIELLLQSNNTRLIPEYIRFLDKEVQARTYASVLGRLSPTENEQEIQKAFALRYSLEIDAAVTELVEMRFGAYRPSPLELRDLAELAPTADSELEMIAALSWLRAVQKWDLLAECCKQLLDIWLPSFQVRAALDLNREISLSKVISASNHATPNSPLMQELNAHYRILAFLTVLVSSRLSGRAVLVRLADVDQYAARGDPATAALREVYPHYCYDQLLKFLHRQEDSAELKIELSVHISNRPGILALLDRYAFLPLLIRGVAEDTMRGPVCVA